MNIGRTIRVFRAEPVVGPLPEPPPNESPEQPAGTAVQQPARTAAEPVVIEAAPAPAPVRLGG